MLTALDDLGVPVVFTTGRPIRWMENAVGRRRRARAGDLQQRRDRLRRGAREVRNLPAGAASTGLEIDGVLREAIPGTTFALEHCEGCVSEPTFPRLHPMTRPSGPRASSWTSTAMTWSRCWRGTRACAPEEFWGRVEELVGHLVTTTWSSTFALVEISAAGVTKATTLATLAADLGIGRDEVIAFGDMPNDLPLLEWAGTSYAMANAHPTVLALADHVAPPNDEDGVAAVLTELFDLSVG